MDLLLVFIELFFARCDGSGATSENRSKIGDFALTRSLWPKISGGRGCPHQSFWHEYLDQWMPYNFVADSFHTKKLRRRRSSSDVRL